MRDSRPEDVEDLRRELATLVVDWAGRMVKDDPASPLGEALAGAVREAASGAVVDQYQRLVRKDAEHIALAIEALRAERRGGGRLLDLSRGVAAVSIGAVAGAIVLAFLLGLLLGRASAPRAASAAAPAATMLSAPLVDTYAPGAASTPSRAAAEPKAPPPAPKAAPAPASRAEPPPARSHRVRTAAAPPPPAPADAGGAAPPGAVSPNAGLAPSAGPAAPAAAAR